MLTAQERQNSLNFLKQYWPTENVDKINTITANENFKQYFGTLSDFIEQQCIVMSENWEKMILKGLWNFSPMIYFYIPENLGKNSFLCLIHILKLCGIQM